MEHPALHKIYESPEALVRLYALMGFALHYANEIEDTMFWCYFASAGDSWEQAVDTFYAKVKFSCKQDRTDEAVSAKLADTEDVQSWRDLNRRIQALLGENNSIRNLISHNSVTHSLYAIGDGRPGVRNVIPITMHMVHEVRQKRAMIERRKRPKVTIQEFELRDYCEALGDLFWDLNQFSENTLGFGQRHRQQYDPYATR
jgi:hypothetical protein